VRVESPFGTNERSDIAYEILAYLAEHADAQDTLEGITEWWLLERNIERRALKVKEALNEFVAQGLVIECQGKDSRVRYRVNRQKYGEILALLKQRPP
jgi:hypothetical protein